MNTLPDRNKYIVLREDIKPELIVYQVMVYGWEGIMRANMPEKLEVVSDIVNTEYGTTYVQCKNCVTGTLERERSYLRDMGVFPRGKFNPHNMHRWFSTEEAALSYKEYVNRSGFRDKKLRNYDESYYSNYDPTQSYLFSPSIYAWDDRAWDERPQSERYSWDSPNEIGPSYPLDNERPSYAGSWRDRPWY